MAFADGVGGHIEEEADLLVVEALHVTHEENLAIGGGESGERLADGADLLLAESGFAGVGGCSWKAVEELGGGACGEAGFATDGAFGGEQVLLAEFDQPLEGGFPQPETEGHWPAVEIVLETPEGVEVRLLDDVGGVEARFERVVEPQLDKAADFGRMPGEQIVECLCSLTSGGAVEQAGGIGRVTCQR